MSWNNIGPELRSAKSLSIFKKNILKIIRPEKKDLFNIHNPNGIKWIFQLRVGLSPLKSHKKLHNFKDTPDDTCQCNLNAENTQHFLLKCPNYNAQRKVLFETLNPIVLSNNIHNLNDNRMVHLLLYGYEKLKFHENQTVLNGTINFIERTGRFSQA